MLNSFNKTDDSIENDKKKHNLYGCLKGVKSEKIKMWFCDKDLSSLDSIN